MFRCSNTLALCFAMMLTATARAADPVYGLDKRPAWQNETLKGFPDPLPPYRTVRTFPKFEKKGLLCAGAIPNSSWLWVSTHVDGYGGPGKVFMFEDLPDMSEPELQIEIPEIIYGLAFHPDFANNGHVFIGCNGKSEQLNEVATKVVRVTLETAPPYKMIKDSLKLIIEWPSNGHNGGDLAFANDGMLYVSAGDGTSDSDANLTGQDLETINGSMIRIDVNRPNDNKPYSVPPDNPFVNVPGAKPEIWAIGLRNPWRVTYDKLSDQLWVGNNGQDLWETAHLIRKGENYGWSVTEGSHPFQPTRKQGPAAIVPPTVEHPHSEARSLTGGIVYRGKRFPDLVGAYLYGDYSTGNIWAVKHDGQRVEWHKQLARSTLQIAGFGPDSHGEVMIVDHEGGLYTLEPQTAAVDARPFPTRLSQSGLFADLSNGRMADGFISYSVQSPLWSDGAGKSRWLAVPTDKRIEGTDQWGWNFPADSVLVKTFTLPIVASGSVSDRRVETRVMVKVDKEWFGYSYAWNDDQTDAELVTAAGSQKVFRVSHDRDAQQISEQTWRYPSRVECMVCHSRAANYVLGLTTEQMNHVHNYGDVSSNQLSTLAHIGLLKMPGQSDAELAAGNLPKPIGDYRQLADPSDTEQPLEKRVRAYLHANCAHCHTNAGGGNSKMELAANTELDKMFIVDAPAQHDTFKISQARLIAPGDSDRSLLLHRMRKRGPGQMPPLASALPDQQGINLIQQWIAGLKSN